MSAISAQPGSVENPTPEGQAHFCSADYAKMSQSRWGFQRAANSIVTELNQWCGTRSSCWPPSRGRRQLPWAATAKTKPDAIAARWSNSFVPPKQSGNQASRSDRARSQCPAIALRGRTACRGRGGLFFRGRIRGRRSAVAPAGADAPLGRSGGGMGGNRGGILR